ncbi:MAG: hypothetical protein AB3X44_02715 [Leptothrix sp. (in: b-proteobacteria)]
MTATLLCPAWAANFFAGDDTSRTPRRLRGSPPARASRPLESESDPSWLRSLPSKRLQEPASLRSIWNAWQAEHPGASYAEAAAALHVAEATLLASMDGAGITPLRPDLAGLLAPAAHWGRFVVEIHHPLGVASLDMAPQTVQLDDGLLSLQDGPQRVLLSTVGLSHCYLVAGPTPGCYGLHWFNVEGDVVARLHLPAHSAQHRAMTHLLQFTVACHGRPASLPAPTRAPELRVRTSWCAIDTMLKTHAAISRMSRAIAQALKLAPHLQLSIEGRGAALSYCGRTVPTLADAGSTEDVGSSCRLSLHTEALTHAFVCIAPDGTPFLRLHSHEEGTITLQPDLAQASAWAWINRCICDGRSG